MAYTSTKPFTEKILKIIQETWPKTGPFRMERIKNQVIIRKEPREWKDYLEVDKTDGIGTKGYLHWKMKTFSFAAQDAFAMNANDLIRIGAEPYRLQNHIMLEKENEDVIISIIKTLANLCKKYKIAITGGETAILDTVNGLEIGITMVGLVKKNEIVRPDLKVGDKLIGIASNGIHSNGLTFARKILANNLVELTKPTEIYLEGIKKVLSLYRKDVHGMVHITGGAFTKLRDISNKKVDIKIIRGHKLNPQPIFTSLKERGKLSDSQMYRTFNNGIGFIIAVDKNAVENVLDTIKKYHKADIIGFIEGGKGLIEIESKFSDKKVIF